MSFESALVQEFGTGELTGKVFPLNAKENTKAPYLVYLSSDGVHDKDLGGFLSSREVPFELNILHSRYSNLKALVSEVTAILRSMPGRSIGTDGPFVQDLEYEDPVELYEHEVKLYRCNIQATAYL